MSLQSTTPTARCKASPSTTITGGLHLAPEIVDLSTNNFCVLRSSLRRVSTSSPLITHTCLHRSLEARLAALFCTLPLVTSGLALSTAVNFFQRIRDPKAVFARQSPACSPFVRFVMSFNAHFKLLESPSSAPYAGKDHLLQHGATNLQSFLALSSHTALHMLHTINHSSLSLFSSWCGCTHLKKSSTRHMLRHCSRRQDYILYCFWPECVV